MENNIDKDIEIVKEMLENKEEEKLRNTMGKYRKIPIEIEAFRIGIDNIPDWFMDKVSTNEIILHGKSTAFEHHNDTHCTIRTLEGNMRAEYGDYVIKGINGEIYPCKPDILEKTYENIKEQVVSEENIRTIEHLSRYLQLKIDSGENKIFYNKENHDEKIIDCMYSLEELTNGYLREKERADNDIRCGCVSYGIEINN